MSDNITVGLVDANFIYLFIIFIFKLV